MNSETRSATARANGAKGGRPSERDAGRAKIRTLLEAWRGEWVPLPAILKLGVAQYNARILELRRGGLAIENKTEWRNGRKLSAFRLRGKS